MPQISFFLGIIIRMFYRDHNPPHFHAVYAEYEGLIDINKLELISGNYRQGFWVWLLNDGIASGRT
jgi:hypothetical protein